MNEEKYQTEAEFIRELAELQNNTGAMAAIRRASKTGSVAGSGAARYVMPMLGRLHVPDWDEDRFFLVAGLFTQVHTQANEFKRKSDYYELETRKNLGWSYRALKRTGSSSEAENSTDQRFIRLLNSHPEDLPNRLRHTVHLLAGAKTSGKEKGVRIDWIQLLYDLRGFGHPERWVQQKWARAFWKSGGGKQSETKTQQDSEPVEA